MLVIGIDPGTTTGMATWDATARRLTSVEGLLIHEAMRRVLAWHQAGELSHVVFEDARLRKWFGAAGAEQLQGAGSIKRDCTIWADFLGEHGIPFRGVSPQSKGAKYDAHQFARLTGWKERTNEHGRDAGMLVFGCNAFTRETA
jgi:hypothetical protein